MTKRSFLPILAALAIGLAYAPPTYAGDVEKAEHTRLSEEMRKLASRNAWSAVEANYKRLEELEKKGEPINGKDHMLGAQAARSLGDITACRARLDRAIKAEPSKEAVDWLAEIDANYGRARISLDPKYTGDKTLNPTVPPFAPDQRAAIATAATAISGGKGYEGLLPAGEYTLGTEKFTVSPGPDKVAQVGVKPPAAPPKEPFKPAFVGPRATLGVAFTQAGDPNDATTTQALGFGGAGARIGVGLEVGLTPKVGVLAEVGYHNLFGTPQDNAGQQLETVREFQVEGNSLHMGYGWLALSYRAGNVWLSAGPVWGAGKGNVVGAAGSEAAANCVSDEQLATEECRMLYTRLNGNIKAGGGAASVSYAMVDLGSMKGALTLEGGAQTDSVRLYPWGQVGLTIAPAGKKTAPRRTE